jgi:hypothetical protein
MNRSDNRLSAHGSMSLDIQEVNRLLVCGVSMVQLNSLSLAAFLQIYYVSFDDKCSNSGYDEKDSNHHRDSHKTPARI